MYFAIFPDGTIKQIMTNDDSDDLIIQEYADRPEVIVLKVEGDVGITLEHDGDWTEVPKEYM